jgi:hypothetical protein
MNSETGPAALQHGVREEYSKPTVDVRKAAKGPKTR